MRKNVFGKVVAAFFAIALVVAIAPAMKASAAEVGDTITFSMKAADAKVGTVDVDYKTEGNYILVDSLTGYVDGDATRDWKYYSDTVTNSKGEDVVAYGSSAGMYWDGSIQNAWVALKVRGVDAGSYTLTLSNPTNNYKGCIYAIYILDDDLYGSATNDEITAVLSANADGVSKVGEVDVYQNTVEKLNFGTANVKKTDSGDVMIVIQAVEKSTQEKIDENEKDSTYFIMLNGLAFTYTGELPAQNEEVFGNSAAFFEKTEDGECNVYFVSAIDSLLYRNAGFEVTVGDETTTVNAEKACTKLTIDGEEYDATDFGLDSGFLFVAKKTISSFAGQVVDFKPFAEGVYDTVDGSTYRITVSGGNE